MMGSEFLDMSTFMSSCGMLSMCFALAVFSYIFLKRYKKVLEDKSTMEKWSNLYIDIHLTRNSYTLVYYPLFLLRRIMYVMVPTILFNWPFLQLQLMMLNHTAYLIYYQGQRPHIMPGRIRIEVFNECIVMCIIYHMFLFSDFCGNLDFQFSLGYTFAGTIGLLVGVNIGKMVFKGI